MNATCLTVGNFDGVHKGHAALINSFLLISKAFNLEPHLITFEGHPKYLKSDSPGSYQLTTKNEKKLLLKKMGIENIHFMQFDVNLMEKTATQFLKEILLSKYSMKMLVMGFNHHFGKNREGTPDRIANLVKDFGFNLVIVPPYLIENEVVSSTLIRNAIRKGHIRKANEYLGRNYKICGSVVKGMGLAGRKLGLKTANLIVFPEKLRPANGIYAVKVSVQNSFYNGVCYVGTNPTLLNRESFEVHIFDYKAELYSSQICVEFIQRLREEQKFDSLDALKNAINDDISKARHILNKHG